MLHGPRAYIVPGPGRGSSRYVESEVIEYCRCLWPSRIRKALACLERLEAQLLASASSNDVPVVKYVLAKILEGDVS